MTDPILPDADVIVGKAIDAIVALRPESLQHFNEGGRWSHLPAMWRAQVVKNLERIADEAKSARLRFSQGDSLRELCASEFNTRLPVEPQTAIGDVQVIRSQFGSLPGGTLCRAGDVWTKNANPQAKPVAIDACTYEVTKTIYVPPGGGQPSTPISIPLRARTAGVVGNLPFFANPFYLDGGALPCPVQPTRPFFDANFAPFSATLSGGSSGLADDVLIKASKAYAIGQFGATDGAAIAGLLRQQSIRHFAYLPAGQLPYARAYFTDESWSCAIEWLQAVAQALQDDWVGFGCRVRIGAVVNFEIAIAPTIVLKSSDDLANTDDIDVNVRAAARSYFDDRPDWYRWRAAHLQAAITKSDPRILHCTSVVVTDPNNNTPVSQQTNTFGSAWMQLLTHYFLTDSNCNSTYLPPL